MCVINGVELLNQLFKRKYYWMEARKIIVYAYYSVELLNRAFNRKYSYIQAQKLHSVWQNLR